MPDEREDTKRVGKVISGEAEVKKKSAGRKLRDVIFSNDIGSVKEYVLYDLIGPAIRDTLVNIINNTADIIFYGQVRGNNGRQSSRRIREVQYDRISSNRGSVQDRRMQSKRIEPDDIIFSCREDALDVINKIAELIEDYGEATIGDYYDACGVTGNGFTDRQWGWRNFRDAIPCQDRGKWYIKLPKVIEL